MARRELKERLRLNSNGFRAGGIGSTYLKQGALTTMIYVKYYRSGGTFTARDVEAAFDVYQAEAHGAINSLRRTGRVKRVGRGVYRVTGSV